MIGNSDLFYIRMLCKISKEITHDLRCKHAAALVVQGKLISIGVNKVKSSPLQKKYTRDECLAFVHAEVDCLKGMRLAASRKTTLYVARLDKDGHMAMSKPCEGCQKLINDLKIQRVVYTIDNGIKEAING